MRTADDSQTSPVEHAAPFDSLLIDASLGPVNRFIPDLSVARWARSLAGKPTVGLRRASQLAGSAFGIVAGNSSVAPDPRDRRFADDAWMRNPVLRRLVQLYVAGGQTLEQLVDDAGLDWRDEQRVRFLVDNLVAAMAPSNLPLVNPASAKMAIDTGGASLVRGAGQFAKDMMASPRIPAMVDESPYVLGENIAATEGQVVYRTEVFELLQYAPQTDTVFEVPLLIVPPTINKFYAIDLAPQRSLVEFSLRQGRQVFVISWRNPEAQHADWNFDTYVSAIIEALDTVDEISGGDRTVLGGICSGGVLTTVAVAYLAKIGRLDRVAALCLAMTVLDQERAGVAGALIGPRLANQAKAMSRRKGYLDGAALSEAFAWLRPDDLVWNYWVNNYLLGKTPPAFDILYWNADSTRMTAGLHADFIDMAMGNLLVKPHALTVLGESIDVGDIDVDAYVVAGIADHLTPWENCFQTTNLLGGRTRFVLSTSGHIAALVNPPGNPKATYRLGDEEATDAQTWFEGAQIHQGTWWNDVAVWLDERSGDRKAAPAELGTPTLPPLAPAPGTYVRQD